MNRIDLDDFYVKTFQLVRTMTVKIEAIAENDNLVVLAAGGEINYDKTTWRYYMNLFGVYHSSDVPMDVISLDTGETIPFTKSVLANHLLTLREYMKGGDLYKRLTTLHPSQTVLINGILNPIPYDVSINAPNYKILQYNRNLVQVNEEQLIPDVQKHINAIAPKLFENEYHVSENLMLYHMIEEFFVNILKAVGLSRFKALRTRFAHDFYIWSHIDSYGDFSRFKGSLNFAQKMWLHKNISWIMNYPGRRLTMERVIAELLTPRSIPLSEYDLVLDTKNQTEDLKPTPLWRSTRKNLNPDGGIPPKYITTKQLIEKELPLAIDNPKFQNIEEEKAFNSGTYSNYSELPTKVLESEMADFTNAHNETLMSVVYNEWIYLAGKNYYRINTSVVDPKDSRLLRLTAKDAYLLYRYLIDKSNGRESVYIKQAFYQKTMKLSPPSINDIREMGLGHSWTTHAIASTIQEQFVSVNSFNSAEELINYSTAVYNAMWNHKKIYSQYSGLLQRAAVKNAANYMYESGVVDLSDLVTYDQFLGKYALNFDEYNKSELLDFAWVIFKTFTGWDLNTNPTLRSVQSDLIALMHKVTSYNLHTIVTMDDGSNSNELICETFIGSGKVIGKPNGMSANFDNVRFGANMRLHLHGEQKSIRTLPDTNYTSLVSRGSLIGRFPDTNVFYMAEAACSQCDTFRTPTSTYTYLEI